MAAIEMVAEVDRGSGVMLTAQHAENDWLSPSDVARRWGVDRKTARRRLVAMNREMGGRLLVRFKGPKRTNIRVSEAKLAAYWTVRAAALRSPEARRLRDHAARIGELEDRIQRIAP